MTMQEKLDERAKNCGYDFAKRLGTYRGCDVWSFCTEEPKSLGYPLFALVKGKKAQVIGYGHKYHQEIWAYANSLPDDDDEDD